MIRAVVDTYGHEGRFIIACLLGFSGFLRLSELLEKKRDECMKILIPTATNGPARAGHIVYLGSTNGKSCTVAWVGK